MFDKGGLGGWSRRRVGCRQGCLRGVGGGQSDEGFVCGCMQFCQHSDWRKQDKWWCWRGGELGEPKVWRNDVVNICDCCGD